MNFNRTARFALVMALAAAVITGSSLDLSAGKKKPVDYAGEYTGTMWGDNAGTFQLTVRSDGTVSGSARLVTGGWATIRGNVNTRNGKVTGSGWGWDQGYNYTAYLRGKLNRGGNASGTWYSTLGASGGWQAVRR